MTSPTHADPADELHMREALRLARGGVGRVSPNPLVGCVITKNGDVIGRGYHALFGEAHAEVAAIHDAEAQGHDVRGATVYVNLEPCSHHGKTPPCVDLLIEKGIARVVLAMHDPNLRVNGKGIEILRSNGVDVLEGVLETEARELNRFFTKHVTTGLPWVTIKYGGSIDGRSATKTQQSKWITSEASRKIVHSLRAEYDAVLVGKGTAEKDDPDLRPRLVQGRPPFRIVLDGKLQLRTDLNMFSDDDRTKTLVITDTNTPIEESGKQLIARGVAILRVVQTETGLDLLQVLTSLGAKGIQSVLVEAGPTLAASFLRSGLFDELDLFLAPIALGADAQPAIGPLDIKSLENAEQLQLFSVEQVGNSNDVRLRYRKTH
jgi:diaminohydroxyphosphoribosylaminopyrimidine deaminase/5-amino-6-(5-phosphoribosylamino)uracil reductase